MAFFKSKFPEALISQLLEAEDATYELAIRFRRYREQLMELRDTRKQPTKRQWKRFWPDLD